MKYFTEHNQYEKSISNEMLNFCPYAWRRFTPLGVMRCRRGLRTTHYIVRPRLTDLGLVTDTVAEAKAEETS